MSELVHAHYVYIRIPEDYVTLYHRIMSLMADYGEAKLKDCTAECLRNNQLVINAYNMFNAAIAARENGEGTLANTLFKYVRATIDNLYRGSETIPDFIYRPDDEGNVTIDIENNILICNGVQYKITPWTPEPTVISVSYSEITITRFTYNNIPASGGDVLPNLQYRQTETISYDDGSVETNIITTNATVEYDGAFSTNGKVSATANESYDNKTIATVKVTVHLNNKTATATTTVIQNGAALPVAPEIIYGAIPITDEKLIEAITNVNPAVIEDILSDSYVSDFETINTVNLGNEIPDSIYPVESTNYIGVVYLIKNAQRTISWKDALGNIGSIETLADAIAENVIVDSEYIYNNTTYKLLIMPRSNFDEKFDYNIIVN